jgi:predicted unusual protein kinase regulating ubiquinone biosynthesis (AarF/ABC1/UbiB family)
VLLADDGRLVLLDFGLPGRLDGDTRRSLASRSCSASTCLWKIVRTPGEL